jgi:putative sterol carrier protein
MKGGWIMALFPSEAWLTELVDKMNTSKEYEEAAAAWEGDLCFVIEAEPDVGIPNDVWAWVDLSDGKCHGFRYGLSAEEGSKARFVLRAPYARWKQVVKQELDPVKGMVSGKIKLKGDIFTMIRHVKAAKAFVAVTGTVQTEFIDEQG